MCPEIYKSGDIKVILAYMGYTDFLPLLTFNEYRGQNDIDYDASGYNMSIHSMNHVAECFS